VQLRGFLLARRGAVVIASVALGAAASGCGMAVGGSGVGSANLGGLTHPRILTRIVSMSAQHTGLITDGTAPVVVHLTGPRAAGSPRPRIEPSIPGSWSDQGNAEVFTPDGTIPPCRWYALVVPARTRAKGQAPLPHGRSQAIHVPCPSTTGLQRTLARLGYLPYTLHSPGATTASSSPASLRDAAKQAFAPPSAGRLRARFSNAPVLATGQMDQVTTGALMAFQADHNLNPDGSAGATTWAKLLEAGASGSRSSKPYTWVTVSKEGTETLQVHRNGHVVLSSPANTGVSGAETPSGAFPIFERFTSTTMTGTNPDGSQYSDPGVPWVNYFTGGDAVHGFDRGSYGSPQSNGCVELPPAMAAKVYPLLTVGTLVVVS